MHWVSLLDGPPPNILMVRLSRPGVDLVVVVVIVVVVIVIVGRVRWSSHIYTRYQAEKLILANRIKVLKA